jgi:hypothetical protein
LSRFIGIKVGDVDYAETLASPRLLSTHLPLSMLPPTVSTCGCKIVYICREAKDAFISRWHFENRLVKGDPIDFHEAFDMFCEGFSPFGPFWDHYLQYWNESLRRPHEVLFLKYEEIAFDPLKVARKLASFLGVLFTEEEQSRGVDQEVVRLCSFETLTKQGVNQTGGREHDGGKVFLEFSSLFRKGKGGDWVNHMSSVSRKSSTDLASNSDMRLLDMLHCNLFNLQDIVSRAILLSCRMSNQRNFILLGIIVALPPFACANQGSDQGGQFSPF